MGKVSDYAATLSAAEREQFRDLIEECSLREVKIQESARRADAAILRLAAEQRLLCAKIREVEQAGQRLLETVSRLYLKSVPAPTRMH